LLVFVPAHNFMKPTTPAVLTLLAVPVFFCAGWLTGRHYRATQPLVRFTAEDLAGRPQHAARKVLDPLTPGASAIEPSDAPRWHWRPWPGERDAFEDAVRSATPSELKAIILSLGEPPEPAWAAQDLFRIWAERDPRGSRWYFEQLPPLSRFALMQDLIAGWAERDASSAVAWLTTQRSNATVSNARASVLSRIAKDDPEKAVELLRTTGWLHESPEAMRSIILTLIERDSAKAMQTWRELNLELNPPSTADATPPVPPFTREVIAWIMKDAEARSPQGFVEAIDLFTPEELRDGGYSDWVHSAVRKSPEVILPALERKLTTDQMRYLVQHVMRVMPEKGEAIARVLSAPELQEMTRPRPMQNPASDQNHQDLPPAKVSLDEPIRLTP
jgi:hypothetical protein